MHPLLRSFLFLRRPHSSFLFLTQGCRFPRSNTSFISRHRLSFARESRLSRWQRMSVAGVPVVTEMIARREAVLVRGPGDGWQALSVALACVPSSATTVVAVRQSEQMRATATATATARCAAHWPHGYIMPLLSLRSQLKSSANSAARTTTQGKHTRSEPDSVSCPGCAASALQPATSTAAQVLLLQSISGTRSRLESSARLIPWLHLSRLPASHAAKQSSRARGSGTRRRRRRRRSIEHLQTSCSLTNCCRLAQDSDAFHRQCPPTPIHARLASCSQ